MVRRVHIPPVPGGRDVDFIQTDMRRHLALHTAVCKFNVGTELRQCFGAGLRAVLADDPALFDRGQILRATRPGLTALAAEIMRSFT